MLLCGGDYEEFLAGRNAKIEGDVWWPQIPQTFFYWVI